MCTTKKTEILYNKQPTNLNNLKNLITFFNLFNAYLTKFLPISKDDLTPKLNNLKNIMDLSAIKLKQVNFINNSRQNIRTNKFHTTQHLPIENMNKNNLFYNQNLKNKINFNNVKFNKLKLNDQKNTNNYEVYNLAKEKNNEDDSNNLHFNNNNNNLQADNSDLNDLNLNQTNTK